MSDPQEVAAQAMEWIRKVRPSVSPQHQAAFANAVMTIVTGWSGGYGGPSVREHAASRVHGGQHVSFEEATCLLNADDGPIFGPLTDEHRACWEDEHCFDDDPSDVEQLGPQP